MIPSKYDRTDDAQYESDNKVKYGIGNLIRWVQFKEISKSKDEENECEFGTIRLYRSASGNETEGSTFNFQLRGNCPLGNGHKSKPRNLIASVSFKLNDLETLTDRARVMDYDSFKFRIKIPSSLEEMNITDIIKKAEDIASETFIKQGNRAVGFTDNDDLRIMMGGKFKSYPDLSKIVIKAYNEKLSDLILTNL